MSGIRNLFSSVPVNKIRTAFHRFAIVGALGLCGFAQACLRARTLPSRQIPISKIPTPQAQQQRDFDPRALQLLQQMADAYTRLPRLDQQTEFYSGRYSLTPNGAKGKNSEANAQSVPSSSAAPSNASTQPSKTNLNETDADEKGKSETEKEGTGEAVTLKPVRPEKEDPEIQAHRERGERKMPRGLHLQIEAPNHLQMELSEEEAGKPQPNRTRWISDGKNFWTYRSDRNWYTLDKAPRRFSAFANLSRLNSGCLELLMIMGINPFAHIQQALDGAQIEGTEIVRGVPTDVVRLEALSPGERTEARLYIGQEDHLLRRLVADTTPTLDPSDYAANPEALAGVGAVGVQSSMGNRLRSRFAYDNILTSDPTFDAATFSFTPPPGAQLYSSPDLTGKSAKARRASQIEEILKSMNGGKRVKPHLYRP